jgi:TnpA family transposase
VWSVFCCEQVGWLTLKHLMEERLDKANVKVIDAYNSSHCRNSGQRQARGDGTRRGLSKRNLLSEYHVRYGGYGGIGYWHVSNMYIAPRGGHDAQFHNDL